MKFKRLKPRKKTNPKRMYILVILLLLIIFLWKWIDKIIESLFAN